MIVMKVEPGKSIGNLSIGMSKLNVEKLTKKSSPIYFRVDYDSNDQVQYIQLASGIKDLYICEYRNIDLFNTKVKDLVTILDKISPYDRNDSELGYSYVFSEIGLSLWRPRNITEEDFEEEWFKEMSLENQEDERKYLFFESLGVFQVL
ncbi:hypothetical protein [Paenibacillus wynnii]|uniref:Uncharacterized protein n=1 Tax=Paenibacillus wynnii TaxID=268407 RepID=A0A098MFG6_9BACL|nr:hypothetical protein [Paenibacillus wynnii]KGE20788.1 hypothetical protein PWYN_00995 [Paenibacillus wynnii]